MSITNNNTVSSTTNLGLESWHSETMVYHTDHKKIHISRDEQEDIIGKKIKIRVKELITACVTIKIKGKIITKKRQYTLTYIKGNEDDPRTIMGIEGRDSCPQAHKINQLIAAFFSLYPD